MKNNVSIIICAYNEEKTIVDVVQKCYEFNTGSEIIVINDGSYDLTEDKLRKIKKTIPFKFINFKHNTGKSNAMVVGVENASNNIILFFDADVSGIKEEHFSQLLDPLKGDNAEADMVLGTPSETVIDYRIHPFKSLTGERALFKKDIDPLLENIRDIRFGVETFINLYYQAHGKKIKYTVLNGLLHPNKFNKTSPGQAAREFIGEGKEIALTLLQNYDLITRRINNSFEEQSQKILESFKKMQEDINDKIQVLLKNNG